MERIDTKAIEILKRELGYKWDAKTYKEILKYGFCGFMDEYLEATANLRSSAKIPTLLKLAKLDLQKGTTIVELVYSCCQSFPKKEAIESLIDLGKQEKK